MSDSAHNTAFSDRLTRLETQMETSLENQKQARERWHDLSNDMQVINGRFDRLDDKVDALNVRPIVEEQGERLDSLEGWKGKILVGVQIMRYVLYVMGVFFTLSIAFGEKLAKLPIWGLLK